MGVVLKSQPVEPKAFDLALCSRICGTRPLSRIVLSQENTFVGVVDI